MAMHYEFKGRHEVYFKAKIRLTGLIVNSNAKNLNSKPGPRRLNSFRLPCQVQRLEVYVRCRPSQHALDLPHLVLLKPKKSHPGFLLT